MSAHEGAMQHEREGGSGLLDVEAPGMREGRPVFVPAEQTGWVQRALAAEARAREARS